MTLLAHRYYPQRRDAFERLAALLLYQQVKFSVDVWWYGCGAIHVILACDSSYQDEGLDYHHLSFHYDADQRFSYLKKRPLVGEITVDRTRH